MFVFPLATFLDKQKWAQDDGKNAQLVSFFLLHSPLNNLKHLLQSFLFIHLKIPYSWTTSDSKYSFWLKLYQPAWRFHICQHLIYTEDFVRRSGQVVCKRTGQCPDLYLTGWIVIAERESDHIDIKMITILDLTYMVKLEMKADEGRSTSKAASLA